MLQRTKEACHICSVVPLLCLSDTFNSLILPYMLMGSPNPYKDTQGHVSASPNLAYS